MFAIVVLHLHCGLGQDEGGETDNSGGNGKKKQSRFVWKRPSYVMPWLKGENVCAVEEVTGTRRRYYSECMTYMPRQICGKKTFIRYHCCTGFERVDKSSSDCNRVAPVENLMNTARDLYLKEFRKFAKKSGMEKTFDDEGALTLFIPENKAFAGLSKNTKKKLTTKKKENNLLLYHTVKDRFYTQDLVDGMELPTMHDANEKLKVSRYSNGILCINCARIILPNQPATNGVIHTLEKVVEPISSQGTVMDILTRDGNFGELVTALVVTGMNNELRSAGPHTVFAPTDAAFRNAPPTIVNKILNDRDLTRKLLQYHIMDQGICAAAIIGNAKLPTKEGQKLELSCDAGDRLTINGIPARETDVVGINGVIHVLDELLVPESVKSLGEVAKDLKLNTFASKARTSGLWRRLEGDSKDSYTVFAPSDDAFAELPDQERSLLENSNEALKKVMDFHMVPGKLTSKQFTQSPALSTTASGVNAKVHVAVRQNKEFEVNNAKISSPDNEAENGVIHVIDKVMIPPDGLVVDKVHEESKLSLFFGLVQASGLDAMLLEDGRYTIFAPTKEAFEEMDEPFLERLMRDSKLLKQFLQYHMLDNVVYTRSLQPDLHYRFKSMTGDSLDLKKEGGADGSILINGEARIVKQDVGAENGVIHLIDKALECPCNKGAFLPPDSNGGTTG